MGQKKKNKWGGHARHSFLLNTASPSSAAMFTLLCSGSIGSSNSTRLGQGLETTTTTPPLHVCCLRASLRTHAAAPNTRRKIYLRVANRAWIFRDCASVPRAECMRYLLLGAAAAAMFLFHFILFYIPPYIRTGGRRAQARHAKRAAPHRGHANS